MTAKKNPAKPTVKIDPPLTDVEKAFLALQNAADARTAAKKAANAAYTAWTIARSAAESADDDYGKALRELDYALRGFSSDGC